MRNWIRNLLTKIKDYKIKKGLCELKIKSTSNIIKFKRKINKFISFV